MGSPFQPESYEMHRALIEQAKRQAQKRRKAIKDREKGSKQPKLGKYTNAQLRGELANRKRARLTLEERNEREERAKATKALRNRFCDHTRHPPRQRKKGPNAGQWYCPTCMKPVPEPRVEEEIVV